MMRIDLLWLSSGIFSPDEKIISTTAYQDVVLIFTNLGIYAFGDAVAINRIVEKMRK